MPVWDTIADVREYQVTRDVAALAKAEAAFRFVADGRSRFALGACPAVDYQQPGGGGTRLKTLETGSNYIKAALLLYQVTRFPGYLRDAVTEYAAVRRYFLSPGVPLYTVYVFDNGSACTQVPGRYFGSVNGNMIWAGLYLARATGDASYLGQAVATARAVARHLGDATGVYADLQAENDVTEPLIEAMYDMATAGRQGFARHWLLAAASAAASGRTASGTYGRFFGGPPPRAPVTAWQVNGGLTLALAAAALDPRGRPADPGFWRQATFVRHDLRLSASPVGFTFTGRAVAIIGTIGEVCCQPGHAQVFVDGAQTYDQTGIWQDKSSSGRSLPDSVLFAWRWPHIGAAHHPDPARRPERQGRRPVLPHDRLRGRAVAARPARIPTPLRCTPLDISILVHCLSDTHRICLIVSSILAVCLPPIAPRSYLSGWSSSLRSLSLLPLRLTSTQRSPAAASGYAPMRSA